MSTHGDTRGGRPDPSAPEESERRVAAAGDGETQGRPRFPRSVYGAGEDPDPRFSLANERTFLAWIRTALAFVAAGLAVEALQVPVTRPLRLAVAVLLVVAGLAAAAQAWFAWVRTERALRHVSSLPSSGLKLPIAVILGAVALAVLVGIVL